MREIAAARSRPQTSQWPVPPDSVRYVIPTRVIGQLAEHPLTRDLYPLAFGHYRHALGHRMHREHHDDDLLIYCTEGQAHLNVCGQPFEVTAGDLLLLPAGVHHRYASNPVQPWTLYWVHYTGPLAGAFREHMGFCDRVYIKKLGRQPRLLVDFNGLLAARQTGFRAQDLVHASNRLRQLLTAVSLCNGEEHRYHGLDLDMIHSYMRDHLSERLMLKQLADLVDLSPAHFATRYRQLTGVAPIQHFLHLKVEQACQRLDSTDLPFFAISAELGYDDSYYFSRLFKKVMGQSPNAYRHKNSH
jgi:AraC family transcriptional regulator, arabinose operon regulatory protein